MSEEIKLIEIDKIPINGLQVVIHENMDLKCAISGEMFNADIRITYKLDSTKNKQIELVSLRKWLQTIKESTIEHLTIDISEKLSKVLRNHVDVSVAGNSPIHPDCIVSTQTEKGNCNGCK